MSNVDVLLRDDDGTIDPDLRPAPGPLRVPGQGSGLRTEVNEYGLLIHNGADGSAGSHIVIKYCLWCGSDLGPNHSDAWFDARGLEPGDAAPQELTDATWEGGASR